MPAAAAAVDLGARIAELAVGRGADRIFQRRPEARPAGAAVIFGLARIERQLAACAQENAGAMLVVQGAGKGPLGRRLAQHAKLHRGEPLFPFGLGKSPAGFGLRPPARLGEQPRRADESAAGRETTDKMWSLEHIERY